jgi:hypothetical protein
MSQVEFLIPYLISVDLSLAHQGYEADVSKLVQVTHNLVYDELKGDAWVMWAIAQRASLPVKIEACIT